jgi:hypothetical protein
MNSEFSTLAPGMSRRDFLQRASAAALAASAMPEHALAKRMSGEEVSTHPLWDLAQNSKDILTLTVWFTAQNVNKFLSNADGMEDAIRWCKQNGVTKVRLEAFGRGSYADRQTLLGAKARFLREGFAVRGGVLTTKFGKNGFGDDWNAQCYTNKTTQEELQRIFEYASSIFDDIIIDDWYFTECQCAECIAACGEQSWSKYYRDLMVEMSRDRIMKPAHAVNPNVRVIIKFPQWYDEFHRRGYDVAREPGIFDGIWVGTESRNFEYQNGPGYEIGYNAYFNMRWLGGLGSVGGGWFDSERTTADTFVEQARHTVLGGGKEIVLWCYGEMIEETDDTGHIKGTPVINMKALKKELPGLIQLAGMVHDKTIKGVHLLKPANSEPFEEDWICSFLGTIGVPFVPAHEIDERAKSAVFPAQVLKDAAFPDALQRLLDKGTPVVITDGLEKRLTSNPKILNDPKLTVLKVGNSPRQLLQLTREELKPIRDILLAPLEMKFDAPAKVELYLFGDGTFVVENFNDEEVEVTLDLARLSTARKALVLPESRGNMDLSQNGNSLKMRLSPRTLGAVEYHSA